MASQKQRGEIEFSTSFITSKKIEIFKAGGIWFAFSEASLFCTNLRLFVILCLIQ